MSEFMFPTEKPSRNGYFTAWNYQHIVFADPPADVFRDCGHRHRTEESAWHCRELLCPTPLWVPPGMTAKQAAEQQGIPLRKQIRKAPRKNH